MNASALRQFPDRPGAFSETPRAAALVTPGRAARCGRFGSPRAACLLASGLALLLAAGCSRDSATSHTQTNAQTNAKASATTNATTGATNTTGQSPRGASGRLAHQPDPSVPGSTVITRGEGVTVTIDDYSAALRRAILSAPPGVLRKELPLASDPRYFTMRAALAHAQVHTVRFLALTSIARHEAAKRNILPDEAAILERITRDRGLRRFRTGSIAADGKQYTLAQLGLTPQDLRELATDMIIRDRLTEKLVEELTDEQLWQAWSVQHDARVALVVRVNNTPSSAELDTFTGDPRNANAIKKYLEANQRRFMYPPFVELTTLSAPPDWPAARQEKALAEAKRLVDSGESPSAVGQSLGLKVEVKQALRREEDRAAFQAKVGDVGVSLKRPRGSYLWKVTGRIKARMPELNRPLRREVAAELMRRTTPLPSRFPLAQRSAQLLAQVKHPVLPLDGSVKEGAFAKLKTKLSVPGVSVFVTPPIRANKDGFVPAVGQAPKLARAIGLLSRKAPVTPKPTFEREALFTARLLKLGEPSRAAFDRIKEEFRATYIKQNRTLLLESYLRSRVPVYKIKTDLTPLRKRFGVVRKPGAIRR